MKNNHRIYSGCVGTRKVYRKFEEDGGNVFRRAVAEESFRYNVDIDPRKLSVMAVKAANNKSGKSVSGVVTVTVVWRESRPLEEQSAEAK
jgi:hypothetical protein